MIRKRSALLGLLYLVAMILVVGIPSSHAYLDDGTGFPELNGKTYYPKIDRVKGFVVDVVYFGGHHPCVADLPPFTLVCFRDQENIIFNGDQTEVIQVGRFNTIYYHYDDCSVVWVGIEDYY